MSDQNAEVVRQLVGAFNRRDLAAMTKWFAPEVEWEPGGPAAVERSLYRGRDESPARCCDLGDLGGSSTWRRARFTTTWMTRLCGWKRPIEEDASQVDFNQPFAVHFLVRGGKVVRFRLRHLARSPRSRRASGVGGVAGERGNRPGRARRVEPS